MLSLRRSRRRADVGRTWSNLGVACRADCGSSATHDYQTRRHVATPTRTTRAIIQRFGCHGMRSVEPMPRPGVAFSRESNRGFYRDCFLALDCSRSGRWKNVKPPLCRSNGAAMRSASGAAAQQMVECLAGRRMPDDDDPRAVKSMGEIACERLNALDDPAIAPWEARSTCA